MIVRDIKCGKTINEIFLSACKRNLYFIRQRFKLSKECFHWISKRFSFALIGKKSSGDVRKSGKLYSVNVLKVQWKVFIWLIDRKEC